MGAFLAANFPAPRLILCSTARRTRETLELLAPSFGKECPQTVFDEGVYEVSPSRLMSRLRALPDAQSPVLVIGHNPGMHGTALELTGAGQTALVRDLATKYPTCALAVLTFEVDTWAGVRPATGHLSHFVTPRGLPE